MNFALACVSLRNRQREKAFSAPRALICNFTTSEADVDDNSYELVPVSCVNLARPHAGRLRNLLV